MQANSIAKIWFRCIIRGSKNYADCPEKWKNHEVKSVVKELLETYGYAGYIK